MARRIHALVLEMDNLAAQTWDKLHIGDRTNLKFREDSITEHNLFHLNRSFGDLLFVRKYNQVAEKSSGADWEWWLGDDQYGWICVRIQAKRSHDTDYSQLDHHGELADERQYDTLIRRAEADSEVVYPFHAFYNGWTRGRFSGHDQTAFRSNSCWYPGLSTHLWGCSLLSSYQVRGLYEVQKKQRSYIPRYLAHSMPWSELFDWAAQLLKGNKPSDWSRAVHQVVNEVTVRGRENDTSPFEPLDVDTEPLPDPMRWLPSYIRAEVDQSWSQSPQSADTPAAGVPTALVAVTDFGAALETRDLR